MQNSCSGKNQKYFSFDFDPLALLKQDYTMDIFQRIFQLFWESGF